MVRKIRSDKKDTICKHCDHECSTSQNFCEHLKQKNLCISLSEITASIQVPIQVPIQIPIQVFVQAPAKVPINDTPFKDHKIEWEYQNLKRRLGKFANLH